MKPIAVVQHVCKKYSRHASSHLNYSLSDLWREIFGVRQDLSLRTDEFLAVDHVSFHLEQGQSLALIGRNGSGKTTLLKMMNGLIKPDAGTILIDGRVQALINLQAGFNPALSGIDNIYNAGALMGLKGRQIRSIVDEIVDFSELEEFIDSPVETYSSGMMARLGFSIAICLQPDLLLIDEILAVGDYAFQNKCFTRMHQIKKQGVSIVLVSHSHTHVVQICEHAIWLHRGVVKKKGPAQETVQAYLNFLDQQEKDKVEKLNRLRSENKQKIEETLKKGGGESIYGPIYNEADRVEDVRVDLLVDDAPTSAVALHKPLTIDYSFRLRQRVSDLNVSLVFFRKDGLKISTISTLNGDLLKHVRDGVVHCRVTIADFNFNPGAYLLVMPIHEGKSYLYRDIVREFVVVGDDRLTWELADFRYDYRVL